MASSALISAGSRGRSAPPWPASTRMPRIFRSALPSKSRVIVRMSPDCFARATNSARPDSAATTRTSSSGPIFAAIPMKRSTLASAGVCSSAEAAKLTNEPFRLELLAVAEFDLGHAAASQQALDALIQKCSEDAPYQIAEVYAWREEHDHAAIWLERAYQQHDRLLRFLKFNPLLRKLHNDPRYSALLRKMRLPE